MSSDIACHLTLYISTKRIQLISCSLNTHTEPTKVKLIVLSRDKLQTGYRKDYIFPAIARVHGLIPLRVPVSSELAHRSEPERVSFCRWSSRLQPASESRCADGGLQGDNPKGMCLQASVSFSSSRSYFNGSRPYIQQNDQVFSCPAITLQTPIVVIFYYKLAL